MRSAGFDYFQRLMDSLDVQPFARFHKQIEVDLVFSRFKDANGNIKGKRFACGNLDRKGL